MSSSKHQVLVPAIRPFKVIHQLVSLSEFDITSKTIMGNTRLSVLPLHQHITHFKLNLSQHIHVRRVSINAYPCTYSTFDTISIGLSNMDLPTDLTEFGKEFTQLSAKIDAYAEGGGELKIIVPTQCFPSIRQFKSLKYSIIALFYIAIDYQIVCPVAGVQFVVPSKKSSNEEEDVGDQDMENVGYVADEGERGVHVYTYKAQAGGMCARYWVPCVDSVCELCLWTIQITVPASYSVVCSGLAQPTTYSQDNASRIYTFSLTTPTSAPNVGWAVGEFVSCVDTEMCELMWYCPPDLLPLLRHTSANAHKLIEFAEQLVALRYPYPSYTQVFVSECPDDLISYAGVNILNVNILYHTKQIDCVPLTRTILAHGLAQQFFGCLTCPSTWADSWLTRGLARYVTGVYIQCVFGNNEYLYHLHRTAAAVTEFEHLHGPVVLNPKIECPITQSEHCSLTCSQSYSDVMTKKAHLVLRIIEQKLGKELFFQVLNKILVLATQSAQQKTQPASWQNMLLSTTGFFQTISNVTGHEIPTFLSMWVQQGGHAHFNVNVSFNRKKNMVELEIKQNPSFAKGRLKYVGPLTVNIQELDGSFKHTVQIDDVISKHDINCHSKARRQKKKKIPLWTGDELDMDLSLTDPDSPVLWIRIDPQLWLIRKVDIQQPDYHWMYCVRYERDVLAQLHALGAMLRFPSIHARETLIEIVRNKQCYFRVRCRAALVCAELCNKLAGPWQGAPPLLQEFKSMFASQANETIPKQNDFSNFQQYFVMQAIPSALGLLRCSQGLGFPEVHNFLLQLLKYNDNTMNKYGDECYRGAILLSLAQHTPSVGKTQHIAFSSNSNNTINLDMNQQKAENLQSDIKTTINELCVNVNLERVQPSYNRVVLVSCLRGLFLLMKRGHIPSNPQLWISYAQPGQHHKVRQACVDCLASWGIHDSGARKVVDTLINMAINDSDPSIRYHIIKSLNPDRIKKKHTQFLWDHLNNTTAMDARVRSALALMLSNIKDTPVNTPVSRLDNDIDMQFPASSSSLPSSSNLSNFNQVFVPPQAHSKDICMGTTLVLPPRLSSPRDNMPSSSISMNNIHLVPNIMSSGTSITVELPPPPKIITTDNIMEVALLSDDDM